MIGLDPNWYFWFYKHSNLLLAIFTIGQLAFQSSSPITCSTLEAEIDASFQYNPYLWFMPIHCIISWVWIHVGKQHLPRRIWTMPLLTDIAIRCILLHTLSQITPLPWFSPPQSVGFTWPITRIYFSAELAHISDDMLSTRAYCVVVKPFRFYLPSLLMVIHELVCLILTSHLN